MSRRIVPALVGLLLGVGLWAFGGPAARAQSYPGNAYPGQAPYYALDRFYYYPYTFFPHNYWPNMSPAWPGPYTNACYQRPPAYMAYPPFREPHWRYELWEPQKYYRGSHFWLDQF